MKVGNFDVRPVAPGTLLRMDPAQHPGGKFLIHEGLFGGKSYAQGHRVFQVKSYILDADGGHVTFERSGGTYHLTGNGMFFDKKFPYPHVMFEVVDDAEAAQIRLRREVGDLPAIATSRWRWPRWLRPMTFRQAHA